MVEFTQLEIGAKSRLETSVENIVSEVRKTIVKNLDHEKQTEVLKEIYGRNWHQIGSLPKRGHDNAILEALNSLQFSEDINPLILEEYRHLENALSYQRRLLCLDMDGLLIDCGKPIPEISTYLKQIRKRHALVVSTAAPKSEAEEMLEEIGLRNLLPLIFGDLANVRGKNYLPIAYFFGYSHPEKHLVAVGHSKQDAPADIDIPFIYLNVPKNYIARALSGGIANLENKSAKDFKIDKAKNYLEVKVA